MMKVLHINNRLIGVLVVLMALILSSCTDDRRYVGSMHSIVVFHSWSNQGEEGEPFNEAMEEALLFHNMYANVHHIYMDMLSHTPDDIDKNYWAAYADSLKAWKPELILINDDPALQWMLRGKHDDVFRELPIIFAGINTLEAEVLQDYMNLTGFVDKIDVIKACEMITNLTDERTIIIELDNYEHDRFLREMIQEELAENPMFIDNSDFHLDLGSPEYLEATKNKTCVMMVSCQNPLLFVDPSKKEKCIETMKEMMKNAQDYTFLQVKYDVYSNTLQTRSGRPMFTCIREQFSDEDDPRIIGGYFTDTHTQVFEQIQYAANILEDGQQPDVMPVSLHSKQYLIDQNAIGRFNNKDRHRPDMLTGLREVLVEGWGEEYTIVNTPFYLKSRRYWIAGVVLFLIALFVVGGWLFKIVNKRLKAYRDQLSEEMEDAMKLRRNILSDADSAVWKSTQNSIQFTSDFAKKHGIKRKLKLSDFEKHVHPDSLKEWNKLKNFRTDLGRRRIRLMIEFQPGSGFHWYDFIYNVTTEASFRWELNGLIISVDDVMNQKQQLLDAVKEAKEVELKEKFLANFRHILQEPLQTVLKNARQIISDTQEQTEEQQEAYNQELHRGAKELIENIDALVAEVQPIVETPDSEQPQESETEEKI